MSMFMLPLLCILKLPVLGAHTASIEVHAAGQLIRRQGAKVNDASVDRALNQELVRSTDSSGKLGDQLFSTEIECDENLDTNTSKNVVLGVDPTVTSECALQGGKRGKGYLTDGHTRVNSNKNKKYWISCGNDNAPAATLSFNTTCVRRVKIWSRPDCCASEAAGVVAQVWDGEAWQQCGDTSTNVGTQAAFTFQCGIKGSKLKLSRPDGSGKMSISEVQLFAAVQPPFCMLGDINNGTNLALNRTPSVSSDCSPIGSSSKTYLTDGEMPSNPKKYWRSCKANNPSATVTFASSSCVRQVEIWARDQSGGTPAGIKAMVLMGSDWTQCGSDAPALGKGEKYTFECNLMGTKIRLKRECNNCRMHLREMKVFSNAA